MLTWAPSLPSPMMLWALLLMPVSLSAQKGAWDNLTCTKGVVSVSSGERAVMDCNISNPLLHVTICLNVPGNHCRAIFNVTTWGHFSQDGWQLSVLEGMAQLVTEEAQASQAGKYKWRLRGGQLTVGTTVLNVSEPWEPPCTPTPSRDTRMLPSRPSATSQIQSRAHVTPVVIATLLCVLVLCILFWHRRRPFLRFRRLPQN